jgi:tetratricopeptide (TPR) repeat protein
MRVITTMLLATALFAGTADAKDPEEIFGKAEDRFRAERYEEAIELYEVVIHEWGTETGLAPRCFLRIAECMVRLGKPEGAIHVLEKAMRVYEERPGLQRELEVAADRIRYEKADRSLEKAERWLREADRVRERAEAAERVRERAEAALRDFERKLEEMRRMWALHGVPPEEIEERVVRIRERQEREMEARREIEDLARRLEADGVPPEEARREIEARERRLREEIEAEWRGDREDELGEVRREFLHLAERLGIPPEEAERFLDEHVRLRSDRPFHGAPDLADDVMHRLEGLERKIGHAIESLGRRLEELERRLHRLEERR